MITTRTHKGYQIHLTVQGKLHMKVDYHLCQMQDLLHAAETGLCRAQGLSAGLHDGVTVRHRRAHKAQVHQREACIRSISSLRRASLNTSLVLLQCCLPKHQHLMCYGGKLRT